MNVAAKEFDGENKYIRITDIDDASREFLLRDISSPDICLEREEVSKYLLSNGDIVFARTGASVGKTYIYKKKDGVVYFAGFLIRVKVNKENDADFIFSTKSSICSFAYFSAICSSFLSKASIIFLNVLVKISISLKYKSQ